jgi:hypothetical protein
MPLIKEKVKNQQILVVCEQLMEKYLEKLRQFKDFSQWEVAIYQSINTLSTQYSANKTVNKIFFQKRILNYIHHLLVLDNGEEYLEQQFIKGVELINDIQKSNLPKVLKMIIIKDFAQTAESYLKGRDYLNKKAYENETNKLKLISSSMSFMPSTVLLKEFKINTRNLKKLTKLIGECVFLPPSTIWIYKTYLSTQSNSNQVIKSCATAISKKLEDPVLTGNLISGGTQKQLREISRLTEDLGALIHYSNACKELNLKKEIFLDEKKAFPILTKDILNKSAANTKQTPEKIKRSIKRILSKDEKTLKKIPNYLSI